MNQQTLNDRGARGMGAAQRKRLLMWLMLSVLAALLVWFGLRAYLSPDLLFHFASGLYC